MYAIKSNGVGNKPYFQNIGTSTVAPNGYDFVVSENPGDKVVAEDGVSLRGKTTDEINADKAEEKWEEIKAYRDKVKAGGVLVSTKWFHTDDASRIQQLGLVQLGANLPAGIMWKTMDGSFIEMTQQLAADIFSAVTQLDIDAFANAETHRAAMEASADPENYDYSSGWPTTYVYG